MKKGLVYLSIVTTGFVCFMAGYFFGSGGRWRQDDDIASRPDLKQWQVIGPESKENNTVLTGRSQKEWQAIDSMKKGTISWPKDLSIYVTLPVVNKWYAAGHSRYQKSNAKDSVAGFGDEFLYPNGVLIAYYYFSDARLIKLKITNAIPAPGQSNTSMEIVEAMDCTSRPYRKIEL